MNIILKIITRYINNFQADQLLRLVFDLTLIGKSWKTHPEIFPKLQFSGLWARPFYWKTHPWLIHGPSMDHENWIISGVFVKYRDMSQAVLLENSSISGFRWYGSCHALEFVKYYFWLNAFFWMSFPEIRSSSGSGNLQWGLIKSSGSLHLNSEWTWSNLNFSVNDLTVISEDEFYFTNDSGFSHQSHSMLRLLEMFVFPIVKGFGSVGYCNDGDCKIVRYGNCRV